MSHDETGGDTGQRTRRAADSLAAGTAVCVVAWIVAANTHPPALLAWTTDRAGYFLVAGHSVSIVEQWVDAGPNGDPAARVTPHIHTFGEVGVDGEVILTIDGSIARGGVPGLHEQAAGSGSKMMRPPGVWAAYRFGVRVLAVPWWCLIAVMGSGATGLYAKALQSRRRAAASLCPACGYDLRATPDRCPECGRIPT